MFKWIRKLFRISNCIWYVEGWDSEHDLDHGASSIIGPFKTEKIAIEYGMKIYGDGLFNVDVMWRP